MDVFGILAGFALGCAGLALGLWAYTWAIGRLPVDQYHAYLSSPEWDARCAALEALPRGQRCAACGTTWDLAEPHHWSYRCLGFEPLWMLTRLCGRHHTGRWSVHWWAQLLTGSRTRALWFTTALVVGTGKAKRVGRRSRATTVRRAA